MKKIKNSTKNNGQVFTPDYLVKNMLDYCNYSGDNIVKKHIIDNSCGDDAFLKEIVKRFCECYTKQNYNKEDLRKDLQEYIHGIELDKQEYEHCLKNLDEIVKGYGVGKVNWDIKNGNALIIKEYNKRMDFVVGNPPYVRVHNLENNYNDVKQFLFANGGMTDLYLVFFEIGFKMLNNKGQLCYITPSSWLTSKAAENMRSYIKYEKNLLSLIDLEHFQPFEATAYTLISIFENNTRGIEFDYYTYNGESKEREFIDRLSYEETYIGKNLYLGTKEKLKELKRIKCSFSENKARVKNGFATLADDVFIGDLPFDKFTINVLKASTGKWYKGFFPYNENGKPLPKEEIFSDKEVETYLNEKSEILLKGKRKEDSKGWYLYGRTQALADVFVNKYAINTIIKDKSSIKLNVVQKGSGLYSGLYITSNVDFETIKKVLNSEEFLDYIKILRNYKSGGYYTFNSKDLEQFLNYKLKHFNNDKTRNSHAVRQRSLFESDF
ncbi:MAG: N-6 DNA methylase [Dysgonamonadaceae bacterium]|jgi:adenine-specific DNA-methyltransferase|nr:N-6 DNA methylase [Dysgonamonadaceae bacterium]